MNLKSRISELFFACGRLAGWLLAPRTGEHAFFLSRWHRLEEPSMYIWIFCEPFPAKVRSCLSDIGSTGGWGTKG